MIRFSVLATAFSFLVLSACGSGGGSVDEHSVTDTPRTRLAAAQNDPAFSQLIQTPKCDAATKSASATVYAAFYTYIETLDGGREFSCDARAQIFIDARTGMMKVFEQCPREGFEKFTSTSRYSIADHVLTIEGFGQIESDELRLIYRARSGRTGVVRVEESEPIRTDGTPTDNQYSFLCGN